MLLLESIKIGKLELKNRMCMPAMHHCYTHDGFVNEKILEYYRVRARGGVALITVGGCTVDQLGGGPNMIAAYDNKFLPGLKKLASAIKDNGALANAQLYHAGRYISSAITGNKPVAPSPVASRLTREEPQEMTLKDIKQTIESFADAACRIKDAGFDGVEIIASAGYLICQFLSPITNKRNDEYGGNWENRCRFGVEVVKKVREKVGKDFLLTVRLSGNDFMPGSNTNEEAVKFAQKLEKAGVDCFNVTGGWHETIVPQITGDTPRGCFSYLARGIKEAVKVPVMASNRINDPVVAERILREGMADMINLGRPLIADPLFPEKVKMGETASIRKCIACNQGCLDMVFSGKDVHCAVNPLAGREYELNITPAENTRSVLVIGGGPAGMQAACTAAFRGHQVTLWEKDSRLGGQLHYASIPPGKQEFINLLDYYQYELEANNVKVVLNRTATVRDIEKFGADVVILATGIRPADAPFPVKAKEKIANPQEALQGNLSPGKNVVVIGGGAVGCETAITVAKEGTISAEALKFLFENNAESPLELDKLINRGTKKVTLVELYKGVGRDIGISTRWIVHQNLQRYGVDVLDNSIVKEVNQEGVLLEKEGSKKLIPADIVVLALGALPANELINELNNKRFEIHVVGDANKPRKVTDAVREGFNAALSL